MELTSKLARLRQPKMIYFVSDHFGMNNFVPRHEVLIVADVTCNDSRRFFQQANETNKFGKPYRWIILGNSDTENMIPVELVDLNVLVDSEVIVSRRASDNFTLNMSYKINSNGQWYFEHFGIWTTKGLIKSQYMEMSVPLRRRNLKLESIGTSMVITDNRTKLSIYEERDTGIDSISRGSFRHLIPLYEFINATTVLLFTDTWGYPTNGTWNGMIGDLWKGKADLGGTVSFFSIPRLQVVEYLSHNIPNAVTAKFVFRQPPLSYQNNLFLLPFKASVWGCIAGFVVMLTLVLYVNAQWEVKKSRQYDMEQRDHTALRPSISDITLLIVSAMSQQGSFHELKGTLGRLVMFILFMIFLFLYTSYSASIVALLQSTSDQIRTLSDLLNSKLELGAEDESYSRHYFSTATDPVKKAIYETKIAPKGSKPNFMTVEEGVRRMQTRPFAFHVNIGTGYKMVERFFQEHEKCGLQEIAYIQNNKPWLCARKLSPNKEIYRIGLFRIKEHGISDRENKLVFATKPACSVRGGNFGSVNMVDFYPVLLLLLCGMILALLLFAFEVLIDRKMKWNRETDEITT